MLKNLRKNLSKFIIDQWMRFTSRKFLLTVAGLLTLAANKQWSEFVVALTAYVGFEGAADAVERYKGSAGSSVVSTFAGDEDDDEDFDRNDIVAGDEEV